MMTAIEITDSPWLPRTIRDKDGKEHEIVAVILDSDYWLDVALGLIHARDEARPGVTFLVK